MTRSVLDPGPSTTAGDSASLPRARLGVYLAVAFGGVWVGTWDELLRGDAPVDPARATLLGRPGRLLLAGLVGVLAVVATRRPAPGRVTPGTVDDRTSHDVKKRNE